MTEQIEQEVIDLARQQGATDYSPRLKMFWRRSLNGWEVAIVDDHGKLGGWHVAIYGGPSESAVRL